MTKDAFQWNEAADKAFNQLKEALCRAPVLHLPDFSIPFVVETDASDEGMGAILSQHNHPIAFFSQQFSPKLLRASTYVRELAAITATVKKWRQYLLGHPFMILTDHHSLKDLMTQAVQTLEQHRYLARLLGFDYTIQYRSGHSNTVADNLSRRSKNSQNTFFLLTIPNFIFLQELRKELNTNTEFLALRDQILTTPEKYPDYSIHSELILQKGRIWLPREFPFISAVLEEFHSTPTCGHMGIAKTLAELVRISFGTQ